MSVDVNGVIYIIVDFQIMTKLVNLVKNLNVTNRKSFELLLLEWINNETLDKDCIKLLWMVFTKSINTSHKDRVIAALILSMVTR